MRVQHGLDVVPVRVEEVCAEVTLVVLRTVARVSIVGSAVDYARPHGLRRMFGWDPHQAHRSATPLELLFDLTLVVSFAQAGHVALAVAMVFILVIAVALAANGVPFGWCLVVVMLSPFVVAVGYETAGYRHVEADMRREAE